MEYDPSDERHKEIMEYLLAEGAAFLDGMDEDGEPIYGFDLEILEEVMPEMHQVIMDDIDDQLIEMYKDGLIEVSYDEELNAHIKVTEQGRIAMIEAGFDLDDSEEDDN